MCTVAPTCIGQLLKAKNSTYVGRPYRYHYLHYLGRNCDKSLKSFRTCYSHPVMVVRMVKKGTQLSEAGGGGGGFPGVEECI